LRNGTNELRWDKEFVYYSFSWIAKANMLLQFSTLQLFVKTAKVVQLHFYNLNPNVSRILHKRWDTHTNTRYIIGIIIPTLWEALAK
jgi:hypothetical protein